MRMRGAVAGCVVLVSLVALLAERTEGHITFFSPKEMILMKEREGRKDMEPRSTDPRPEVTTRQPPQVENIKTREIPPAFHPDHMAPVVEEMIHEIAEAHQKSK